MLESRWLDQTTSSSSHVSSEDVSPYRTSAFNDQLDHSITVFKNEKRCAFGRTYTMMSVNLLSAIRDFVFLAFGVVQPIARCQRLQHIRFPKSHRVSAGIPSNLRPASDEIIAASVLLCDTAVCFLQVQLAGTNVWLPKNIKHSIQITCKTRILK